MRTRIAVVACIAVLALPLTAAAQGARPWLAAGVGFHTYAMGDVNDDISSINAVITPLSMDEINSGIGFGGAVGVSLPAFTLAVSYERLTGSSDVSDGTGRIEYRVPANLFMAEGVFQVPTSAAFGFGVGAAVGRVSSAAEVEIAVTGLGGDTAALEGSGPAVAGFVTGSWPLGPRVAVVPMLGYRYAKIGEVKVDGDVVYKEDGSKYELDYSGLMAKLMLRISL